jgi:hypothetical protein
MLCADLFTKEVWTFCGPDANAHAERWVGSVTGECLDHLVLFGMSSLLRALGVYRDFFNGHRPHQGIGNRIPERRATGKMSRHCADRMSDRDLAVACEQFLGVFSTRTTERPRSRHRLRA